MICLTDLQELLTETVMQQFMNMTLTATVQRSLTPTAILQLTSYQTKNHENNGFINFDIPYNKWSTLNEYSNYINRYDEDFPGVRGYIGAFNEKESIYINENYSLT